MSIKKEELKEMMREVIKEEMKLKSSEPEESSFDLPTFRAYIDHAKTCLDGNCPIKAEWNEELKKSVPPPEPVDLAKKWSELRKDKQYECTDCHYPLGEEYIADEEKPCPSCGGKEGQRI